MPADANSQSSAAQARRLEAVYEQLSALLQRPDVAARLRTAPASRNGRRWKLLGIRLK